MSVIRINAITVAADSGDELARRFAARAGAVDGQDGFEGFELLQPTDGRTTWLVVTRWRDEAAFEAWTSSAAFGRGHRSAGSAEQSVGSAGQSAGSSEQPAGSAGQSAGSSEQPAQRPVGVSSELWSYRIAGGSADQA